MEMEFHLPILSKTAFAVVEIERSIAPAASITM